MYRRAAQMPEQLPEETRGKIPCAACGEPASWLSVNEYYAGTLPDGSEVWLQEPLCSFCRVVENAHPILIDKAIAATRISRMLIKAQ